MPLFMVANLRNMLSERGDVVEKGNIFIPVIKKRKGVKNTYEVCISPVTDKRKSL